jgi:hypothetical protein
VPWIRRLVSDLIPPNPGLDRRSELVGFEADKLILKFVLLEFFFHFSAVTVIPLVLHIFQSTSVI